MQATQGTQLRATQDVCRRPTLLQAADVHVPLAQVDHVPAQADQLGDAQAVPVRDEDHRAVAVRVAAEAFATGLAQSLHLFTGQELARSQLGVGAPWRRECPIYGGWGTLAGGGFGLAFHRPSLAQCPIYGHKRTFPFMMVGRDGARSEKPRRSRASLPDHPSRVMRIGGACCVRGTAPGAIPLAVWRPGGAWGGFASLRSLPTGPVRSRAGPLLSRGTVRGCVPPMTLDGKRGGAMVAARREAMR